MSKFTVTSNTLYAIDPCYVGNRSYKNETICNVVPGVWDSTTVQVPDNLFKLPYPRIAELIIWNTEKVSNHEEITDWKEDPLLNVSVDSGQAGFFDASLYPTNPDDEYEKWYLDICDQTEGPEVQVPFSDKEIQWRLDSYRKALEKIDNVNKNIEEMVNEYHEDLKTMYNICYANTDIANVGFGVATASGYGDGGYGVQLHYDNNGNVIAAKIIFISDNNF